MKNYKEITNDLLERRDRYALEQRRKKKIVTGIVTSLCCVSLVFLMGLGIWQTGIFTGKNVLVEDGTGAKENDGSLDDFTIISSYDYDFSASYMEPENGKFGLTEPLKEAIHEYGDTVRYMVAIIMSKDEEQLSLDKTLLEEEAKRLEALGYNAFIEENAYYLTILATAKQILNFNCNEEYGYLLLIHSEVID